MSEQADAREVRAAIEERFRRDWGIELPESIFRFWAFHQSLGLVERQALHRRSVDEHGRHHGPFHRRRRVAS